ncbi:At-rich interactive domain-containing protein, partial [Thalictrum thalictroides]
ILKKTHPLISPSKSGKRSKMKPISEDPVISSNLKDIHCSSFRQVDEIKDEKLDRGFSSDSESVRHKHTPAFNMLLWLKSVAVDHYWAKISRNSQEPENQIIVIRKFMSLSHDDAPWKKRKLNQLLEETVTTASDLSRGKDQCSTRRRKYTFPSHSGLIYCADSEGSSDLIQNPQTSVRLSKFVDKAPQKRILTGLLFQPDELERSGPSDEEVELLLDSDDPVSGSNLSSPTKSSLQTPQHKPIKLLMSGNNDPRKQVCISRHKGVPPVFKHDDLVNVANSSKKARKYMKPLKSSKSIDFFGDDFCRFPIPVGPRFQADIPERSCKPNCSTDGDANIDNSGKWLGTCIWPIKDRNAETSREFIGKGRPSSCSCNSPGSTQCIKLHIRQSRLQLQHDLGSAFFDWKFDEMGEEVAKLWTPSEQRSFELLVKNNPTSKNMSFWKPALKLFSSKSRTSIVSYYFNVVVLRRISRQTRLACKVVDTDDDETDEGVGRSDTKARYLTGIR